MGAAANTKQRVDSVPLDLSKVICSALMCMEGQKEKGDF